MCKKFKVKPVTYIHVWTVLFLIYVSIVLYVTVHAECATVLFKYMHTIHLKRPGHPILDGVIMISSFVLRESWILVSRLLTLIRSSGYCTREALQHQVTQTKINKAMIKLHQLFSKTVLKWYSGTSQGAVMRVLESFSFTVSQEKTSKLYSNLLVFYVPGSNSSSFQGSPPLKFSGKQFPSCTESYSHCNIYYCIPIYL